MRKKAHEDTCHPANGMGCIVDDKHNGTAHVTARTCVGSTANPPIRFRVDPSNPGQFFACCGLLEIADLLWGETEGWFDEDMFCIRADHPDASLPELLDAVKNIILAKNKPGADHKTPPLLITSPVSLRLDWWGNSSLKTWAAAKNVGATFESMCNAIDTQNSDPMNQVAVNTREPFYFDSRLGTKASPIDVGFSIIDMKKARKLKVASFPVVESMCLVGLQRCRPRPTGKPRVFDYYTWNVPLPIASVPATVVGFIKRDRGFRFQNAFHTSSHKAFYQATSLQNGLD